MPRPVLIIGHPGHELLVHDWMTRTRPIVLILTDGSGSAGAPRIDDSRRIVEAAGATPGPVFGAWPDSAAYAAILAGDPGLFVPVARAAAQAITAEAASLVVCDAIEHFNPVHDLCGVVAALACALAGPPRPALWEIPIEQPLDYAALPEGWQVRRLAPAAVARRRSAAESVPALAGELARRSRERPEAEALEILAPVADGRPLLPPPDGEPFYETFGRRRLAEGVYRDLITWRGHVAPLARALAEAVLGPAAVG
ncbi:MAG TPA: hypothetical protein VG939_16235 [Caulobacteraceae bacterium]|nr:hypothetical protein [Caulobacteraceae bacterium]